MGKRFGFNSNFEYQPLLLDLGGDKLHRYGPLWKLILIALCWLAMGATAKAAPEAKLSAKFSPQIMQLADLLDQSAYEEVYTSGAALLPDVRAEFDGPSYDEAKILDFMVHSCYRSRRVMDPEALVMADNAVRIKEDLLGHQHPELATSLMHLGNLYSRRWEPELAIPYYDRAVRILTAAGPGYDDQRAIILSSTGVAYRRLSQNKKALELYGQALVIQEQVLGPDHPDVASTLNNQAVVLGERGDYAQGVKAHRRALAIREKQLGPDHEWVGESCNNLASQLGYLGMYDESLAAQERAVQIFRDQLGTDHQRYLWAKLNLGIAYQEMGDPAGALPICHDVLVGLENLYGPGHPEVCYVLDALGSCHYGLEEYEVALDYYSQSLRNGEAAYGEGSFETAEAGQQMGRCLIALGRLDEAVERLNRSLESWENYLEKDNALMCSILNRLAELQLQRNDHEQALAHARRSIALGLRDLGDGHPLVAEAYLLAGQAQFGLGNNDGALASALLAESISRKHLQSTMRVLSEDRALDYAGSRIEGLNLAMSLLFDGDMGPRVAQVWDAVVRSRSAVLDEYTARNRFLSDRNDDLTAALMDSSLVLRERLANLTLRGPGWEDLSVYHGMLAETEVDLKGVERQLSLRSASFRRWQSDHGEGFAQIAESLPTDSALVAYMRRQDESGATSYVAFVLPEAGAEPRVHVLGQAEDIDAAVAAWRDQATFGTRQVGQRNNEIAAGTSTRGFLKVPRDSEEQMATYLEAGIAIRRLVWDPLAIDLARATTVFLVPDGSLHLLSYPSLPLDDGHFLVESGSLLHLLTSEKTLIGGGDKTIAAGRLLALGGPDYGGEAGADGKTRSAVSVMAGLQFNPLPHARTEVDRLGAIWAAQGGEVELVTGPEATEERLKQALPTTQVLHLATHGFFLPGGQQGDDTERWDNPLTRSGLALAGANDWRQAASGNNDGILTAEEVSALDMTDVQWAVLSACDTGLGEVDGRGEGVFGLRRVFTLAGAKTVIMSLWSVDDECSRDWMSNLYRARWQDGLSTAAAVRQASCEILHHRREAGLSVHPYYWAGFVAAGDWR